MHGHLFISDCGGSIIRDGVICACTLYGFWQRVEIWRHVTAQTSKVNKEGVKGVVSNKVQGGSRATVGQPVPPGA